MDPSEMSFSFTDKEHADMEKYKALRCAARESRLRIPRKWEKENILSRPPIVEQPVIPLETNEDEQNATATRRVTYSAKGFSMSSAGVVHPPSAGCLIQISDPTATPTPFVEPTRLTEPSFGSFGEQIIKENQTESNVDNTSQYFAVRQAVIRLVEMSEDPDLLKNPSFASVIDTLFAK